MTSISGRVAVITGAGSGIGRALAYELARRGARLAISDVDEVGLAETGRQARLVGADVCEQRLDVADRDAMLGYAETVPSTSAWCTSSSTTPAWPSPATSSTCPSSRSSG
jgi:NAD(P)-dependent dehydrogenase (short-subunit alcohol dehydrogenase family)